MRTPSRLLPLLPALLLYTLAAAAPDVYICRLGNKAVYTSYPQKLPKGRCQKSAMEPVDAAASDAAAGDAVAETDPISQLWYDLEFGHIDDNIKISHPEPVSLPPAARGGAHVPAALPPPKPPTRRQLVERDIAAEKHALAAAQSELAAARAARQNDRIQRLQAHISDRLQNIRALETELQRY